MIGKTIDVDGHILRLFKPDIDTFPGDTYEVRVGRIGESKYEIKCPIGALDANYGEIFIGDTAYIFTQDGAPDCSDLDRAPALRDAARKRADKLCKRLGWLTAAAGLAIFAGDGRVPALVGVTLLSTWCLATAIDVHQRMHTWYFCK